MTKKIGDGAAVAAVAASDKVEISQGNTTQYHATITQIAARVQLLNAATAAQAKDTTDVTHLLTPANLLNVGAARVCWTLIGADMNSTADQAFTKVGTWSTMIPMRAILFNASASLTTAAGGVYSATSKGGAAIIAAASTYANASTATSSGQALAFAGAYGSIHTFSALYLSLTTPQGSAATADYYIIGCPIT